MHTFWTYFFQLTLSLVARAKKKSIGEKKKNSEKEGRKERWEKALAFHPRSQNLLYELNPNIPGKACTIQIFFIFLTALCRKQENVFASYSTVFTPLTGKEV